MSEPETRSLLGWEHENPDVYKQEAIPWCTTHDAVMVPDEPGCTEVLGGFDCVLSTGGPDHKWWKDA